MLGRHPPARQAAHCPASPAPRRGVTAPPLTALTKGGESLVGTTGPGEGLAPSIPNNARADAWSWRAAVGPECAYRSRRAASARRPTERLSRSRSTRRSETAGRGRMLCAARPSADSHRGGWGRGSRRRPPPSAAPPVARKPRGLRGAGPPLARQRLRGAGRRRLQPPRVPTGRACACSETRGRESTRCRSVPLPRAPGHQETPKARLPARPVPRSPQPAPPDSGPDRPRGPRPG